MLKGRKRPAESVAKKAHAKLDLPNCNCYVHSHNNKVSELTWLLADALAKRGFLVQPEARLGRRSVDALLLNEWIAFEADGEYWHRMNESQFPDYHQTRDAELNEIWDLPTVHLTEQEVRALAKE